MAIATLLTHATFVLVLRLVTGETLNIRFLELGAQMARFTSGHPMDANERKTGNVVLEKDPLVPGVFIVAIATVLPQVALMYIGCPMTVDAGDIAQRIHGG